MYVSFTVNKTHSILEFQKVSFYNKQASAYSRRSSAILTLMVAAIQHDFDFAVTTWGGGSHSRSHFVNGATRQKLISKECC